MTSWARAAGAREDGGSQQQGGKATQGQGIRRSEGRVNGHQ
jgi:hypothetical protein